MSKFKKVYKNEWGKFEAFLSDDKQHLSLKTAYPAPNARGEIGYSLNMALTDYPSDPKEGSYDGMQINLFFKDRDFGQLIYLEMGYNQLEALRQHLNDWHNERLQNRKIKE